MTKKHLKSAWVSMSSEVEKSWGHEVVWPALDIMGKILFIKKGKQTKFKYNTIKSEVFFVVKGTLKVMYGNEETLNDSIDNPFQVKILEEGSVFNVQSHCPYTLVGVTDCEVTEIGTKGGQAVYLDDEYDKLTGAISEKS